MKCRTAKGGIRRRGFCRPAAHATLALALLTACQPGEEPPPPAAPVTERLAAALAAGRWIEPRLSAGAAYQECERVECPADKLLCEPSCASRESPAGRHLFSAAVSSSPGEGETSRDERKAAALWALIRSPDAGAAGEAIEMLQELVTQNPRDAGLLSDLAAAHIVAAQRMDEPVALTRALVAAQRAVELDPAFPAARFNRALASTLLALEPDARAAWGEYLELEEDGSPWAGEARRRWRESISEDPRTGWERAREALAAAALRGDSVALRERVEPFRTAAQQWVEREVLPDWARAFAAGSGPEAEVYLAQARRVAAHLAELTGDSLLADAVAAIDRAAAGRHTQRLERLAEGHRLYGEAAREASRVDLRMTLDRYRRAAAALGQGESPFRAWAEVSRAVALYQAHRLPEAVEILKGLQLEPALVDYPSLQGRIFWMLGLCQIYSNLPNKALRSLGASLASYRDTGERENLANLHVRMAEVSQDVGNTELSWRHRYLALRELPSVAHPRARVYILGETASKLLKLDLPTAALELQKEALEIARAAGDDPLILAVASRDYAEVSRHFDPREARAMLRRAFDHSRQVPQPMGNAIRARLREVEAELFGSDSPQRAIDALSEALELLPVDEYLGYRARLYLKRSAAFRKATAAEGGDPALVRQANDDLARSLEAVDREWEKVLAQRLRGEDEELWSSYFGQPQETFDLMIGLLVDEGRHARAFEYAERARARDLLALVTDPAAAAQVRQPKKAGEVTAGLPPGTALVEYALLDDRLVVWILRRNELRPALVEKARSDIDGWAEQVSRTAQEDEIDASALHALSSALLGAVTRRVSPGEKLVFVLDGSLHGVPLAALRNPATGRFLIEDHPIAVAPSATLYLHALERDREIAGAEVPRALFVGDPAFEPRRILGLERLSHARQEAEEAAGEYAGATRLMEEEATREAFLERAGDHDVVHFAGHAVLNAAAPFKSMLVLAPSAATGDTGELYADELLREELPRTRLVVLSACSTGGGSPVGALGVAPLVRPFLGAGVPAVVGSLWDVRDDPATRRLLTELHRRFRSGADAATALQGAQVALLESGSLLLARPRSWAAFQVVGTASLSHPQGKE